MQNAKCKMQSAKLDVRCSCGNGGDVQVVVDTLIYVVGVGTLDNPFVQV